MNMREHLRLLEEREARRKEYLRTYNRKHKEKNAAAVRRRWAKAKAEREETGAPTLVHVRASLNTGRYQAKNRGHTPCNATAQEVLDAYTGVCYICGRAPEGPRDLHIDHDHSTGVFRGWLCGGCNVGLGAFRDDMSMLERAAAYLKQHLSEQIL